MKIKPAFRSKSYHSFELWQIGGAAFLSKIPFKMVKKLALLKSAVFDPNHRLKLRFNEVAAGRPVANFESSSVRLAEGSD